MDLPESTLPLGNFSVSLTVKDIKASRAFYEKLGFVSTMGEGDKNWLIMVNGSTVIGLFQGMFDKNLLTFNPGWGPGATPLDDFVDVREIQAKLEADGIEITTPTDPDGTDPAHIVVVDPDGNPVLLDQHVPRPSKD